MKSDMRGWAVALVCLLSSCGSVRVISFDELVPAKYNFPSDTKRVAVVNNMPEVPASQAGLLTLGEFDAEGKASAESLAASLADTKYFNEVVICDSALCAKSERHKALSQAEVRKLADDLGADVILSVDRVMIRTSKEDVFYPELAMVWQALKMKVTPVLSVYTPLRGKALHTIVSADSVYWDPLKLTSDKQLMEESSLIAAEMLTRQLAPYWRTVERAYFGGGCVEMRDAEVCLQENDWEEAKKLWLSLFDRYKKGQTKMKAAFNIALAYEMTGDLSQAREWLDKALPLPKPGSREEHIVKTYDAQLKERMETIAKLNIQMERFRNNFEE